MLESVNRRTRRTKIMSLVATHPWRAVAVLLPVGVAMLLAVDLALGATAEYFNAFHLVQAWVEVLTGGSVSNAPGFMMNQGELGAPLAMAIGTALLVVEPAALLALIVFPVSFLVRRVAV